MATHGTLYIPLNPQDPKSPMLHCEAYSDGYLSGIGYGALNSSREIETVCKLSELFAGGLVFYNPKENQFRVISEDYLHDYFVEASYNKSEEEAAQIDQESEAMMAAIKAIHEGRIEEALAGDYSKISLSTKIDKGYSYYDMPKPETPCDKAWADYMSYHDIDVEKFPQALSHTELANHMALCVKNGGSLQNRAHSYFWHEGQFWGIFSFESDSSSQVDQNDASSSPKDLLASDVLAAPLIMIAAVKGDSINGCYADLMDYLPVMTDKDNESLFALIRAFDQHDLPPTRLFSGASEMVLALFDQMILTQAVDKVPMTSSESGKVKAYSL